MSTVLNVVLVILVILVIILAVLYYFGRKMEKRQVEQQSMIDAAKQVVTIMAIDKKKMKIKDAGLPSVVLENTPKLMRGSKLPIVKAKIGPQVMSLVCDAAIFDQLPVKKEVKATVSGIYITGFKGLHGKIETTPVKKSRFKKMVENLQEKAGAKPVK